MLTSDSHFPLTPVGLHNCRRYRVTKNQALVLKTGTPFLAAGRTARKPLI